MTSASKIEVKRLSDGQVSVRKGSWRDVFPEERRDAWAAWYERMHADYGYSGYLDMAKAVRDLDPAAD
ncbi:hypothetical protein R2C4_01400 (plasmid) [Leisingera aquaemixtae]|jgi:hypothetical protein|nr:hypothetical protein R2C4_01400 [Leisingera aquaemixtae]